VNKENRLMAEICPVCGLPKAICVCETISREQQKVLVRLEARKYRKPYTVIEGLDGEKKELHNFTSKLKTKLACGGAFKNGQILLQGDHRERVIEALQKLGIPSDSIQVI